MKYIFGIDVGGTTIKAGLFEESGKLLKKWSIPTRKGENGALIYDDIAAEVTKAMAEEGIPKEDVLGVGLTMPGPVYEDGCLGACANLSVKGGDPGKEISERLSGIPSGAENDANAAALGEQKMGAGKGYRSLCMVTLGTGVGGGIILKGNVVVGKHGTGGEIGHIPVMDGEKEHCGCGGSGCCEQYASATGIVRVAKRMAANGDPMIPLDPGKAFQYPESEIAKLGDSLSAKDVCDLARSGDELAVKALSFSMEQLAKALAVVAYTADPEAFLIGGGVSAAFDVLEPLLRQKLAGYTTLIDNKDLVILPAKLGNDAGICGAAALFLP